MFYRSDDPLADFARWDEDQQRWLESRPKCTDCGEHIQDEEAYHINGQWICPEYERLLERGGLMAAEKSFEEKLKNWLESEGIYPLGTAEQDIATPPCGYWEKRWGGGKYIKSGMPDMHIVVNGISIEVELKAPNGRPSELQIQKLNQIDDAGCIGVVLFPKDFENFKKLVKHIKCSSVYDINAVTFSGLERGWRR